MTFYVCAHTDIGALHIGHNIFPDSEIHFYHSYAPQCVTISMQSDV